MNPIFIGTISVDRLTKENRTTLCSCQSLKIILITPLSIINYKFERNSFIPISIDAKINVSSSSPLLSTKNTDFLI